MRTKFIHVVVCALMSALVLGGATAVRAADQVKKGGFKGPGVPFSSVEEAAKMRDDTPVSLQGHIVRSHGSERYIFEDATGTILIEIDDDDWGGLEITPEIQVVIEGEVEKKWGKVRIDVDHIRLGE